MTDKIKKFEARFILVIFLVQFINILDFMMVMPLGPDFAKDLGIPVQHLGYIGGSYTLAASITGLIASLFLDQYDRKKVILVSLIGLAFSTILPAFATNMEMLMGARILAGIFGGPMTAASLSMLADVIPAERRGAATGKVMGGFSLASVLGVPFGLELAVLFSWKMPFIMLGAVAFIVFFMAYRYLPENTNERSCYPLNVRLIRLGRTLQSALSWNAWGFTIFAIMASFMIIPNVAAHVQFNMGFPRDKLGLLYLAGGFLSFFSMRYVGKLVDQTSATIVSLGSVILYIVTIIFGVIFYKSGLPPMFLFIGFMIATTSRNVAGQTLSSKVPLAKERASFMSIQSSMVHAACSVGAFLSSMILVQSAEGQLLHMDIVGTISCILMALTPVLVWRTEGMLERRAAQPAPAPETALSLTLAD